MYTEEEIAGFIAVAKEMMRSGPVIGDMVEPSNGNGTYPWAICDFTDDGVEVTHRYSAKMKNQQWAHGTYKQCVLDFPNKMFISLERVKGWMDDRVAA